MRIKIPGSSGTKGPSRNTSKIPRRRFRAPKWCFRGLRTRRKPKICGASSSSSDRTARRNEQFSSRFILIIESVVDRIEVDDHAIRIIGDEATLEQVIVGSKKAAPGVRSFVPKLSGLLAALLAEQKFLATTEFLTAKDGGLYSSYADGGKPEAVTAELGRRWELEQI